MKKIKLEIRHKPERIESLPFECAVCGNILAAWKRKHDGRHPMCIDCYHDGNPRNSWNGAMSYQDHSILGNISAAIKLLENACVRR